MKWVVQSVAEGYAPDGSARATSVYQPEHDIASAMETMSLTPDNFHGIAIINKGHSISPASFVIDIACMPDTPAHRDSKGIPRHGGKRIKNWFSQTPQLVLACHDDVGSFTRIHKIKMASEYRWFENQSQSQGSLKKLMALMELIRQVAEKQGGRCCLECLEGEQKIQFLRSDGEGLMLPEELKEKYWGCE
jgi:hypothetical protein